MIRHPRIVYKFRDWKNEKHLTILTRQEIYFSSPKDFNDPFDCRIPNNLEMLDTDQKIDKFLSEIFIRVLPDLDSSKIDIKRLFQQKREDFRQNKPYYQKALTSRFLADSSKYFGIFSTSSIWNNIQMWAHYSNNHTGFCVGFNRKKLIDSIQSCNSGFVKYSKEFPKIDPLDDIINQSIQKSHTKEKNWKYEKEYRFYKNNFPKEFADNLRVYKIDKACYNCILIGLGFPEKDIRIIKGLALKLDIPLYRVTKSDLSFNLQKEIVVSPNA